MKFLSTWLRNVVDGEGSRFDCRLSSMKFLSTWLRNIQPAARHVVVIQLLNEVPEHMAQESGRAAKHHRKAPPFLNEVPEHMAQEWPL